MSHVPVWCGVHWQNIFIYYVCIGIFQTTIPCKSSNVSAVVSWCRVAYYMDGDSARDAPETHFLFCIYYYWRLLIWIGSCIGSKCTTTTHRQCHTDCNRFSETTFSLFGLLTARLYIAHYFIQSTFRLPHTLHTHTASIQQQNDIDEHHHHHHTRFLLWQIQLFPCHVFCCTSNMRTKMCVRDDHPFHTHSVGHKDTALRLPNVQSIFGHGHHSCIAFGLQHIDI